MVSDPHLSLSMESPPSLWPKQLFTSPAEAGPQVGNARVMGPEGAYVRWSLTID